MKGMSAYFSDGVNPNDAGYTIMGHFVYDSIMNSPGGFIRTFNAKPQKFEIGDSVTLYWETSPSSQVTTNNVPVSAVESMVIYPVNTIQYTLIARGDVFTDTNSILIEYIPPVTVKSLTANPKILEYGTGDSSLVTWIT